MMTNINECSFFLLFYLVLFSSFSFGQKLEIEKRIKQQDFPENALLYLEEKYGVEGKIKFYMEKSGNEQSFEAKFIRDYQKYSVEFYEDGRLMDVEIEVPYEDIPKASRSRMEKDWKEDFEKSRVRKVQKQKSDSGLRYEVIVRGKKDKNSALYEYLFESDGQLVKSLLIVARPDDLNLY